MSVEFILALGLIVALNELKEWRAGARIRKIERMLSALPAELKLASQTFEESVSYARKAQVELETLNRTIDAYGVRINFRDQAAEQPDFVEGL